MPTTFEPHPLLWNGHLQTIAAHFLGALPLDNTTRHTVTLADGDVTVLHDDRPQGWRAGERAVLLVHGLGGSHESAYMIRLAARLKERGLRAFRIDMRGSGAAIGLSRSLCHAGRSSDLVPAIEQIAALCPGSPLTLIGFSMGGNIVLKLAGELGSRGCGGLDGVIAVCPPVDLLATVEHMARSENRAYHRWFVHHLRVIYVQNRPHLRHRDRVQLRRPPRTILEFDRAITAPLGGFPSAADYYRSSSCGRVLEQIALPTLILATEDDPLIPAGPLASARLSASTRRLLLDAGGHLGFIARGNRDPDRRWMDWRLLEWVADLDA